MWLAFFFNHGSQKEAQRFEVPKTTARSPSSALLSLFVGEGSPTKIDHRKKLVPFWGLIPHSFQPSFFAKNGSVFFGFRRFSRKKDPWKEWKWKVPLEPLFYPLDWRTTQSHLAEALSELPWFQQLRGNPARIAEAAQSLTPG